MESTANGSGAANGSGGPPSACGVICPNGEVVGEELPWVVNKFGGTSVASAEAMCQVRDIVMGQVQRYVTRKKQTRACSSGQIHDPNAKRFSFKCMVDAGLDMLHPTSLCIKHGDTWGLDTVCATFFMSGDRWISH